MGDLTGVLLLDLACCLLEVGDLTVDFCSSGSGLALAGVFLALPDLDLLGVELLAFFFPGIYINFLEIF